MRIAALPLLAALIASGPARAEPPAVEPILTGQLEVASANRAVINAKMRQGKRGVGLNDPYKLEGTLRAPVKLKRGTALVFSLIDLGRPQLKIRKTRGMEHPLLGYATVDWPESKRLNFVNRIVIGERVLHLRRDHTLGAKPEGLDPT